MNLFDKSFIKYEIENFVNSTYPLSNETENFINLTNPSSNEMENFVKIK